MKTKLIIGLGNPGAAYEKTRHNVGFMMLDMIADKAPGFSGWKKETRWSSWINQVVADGKKIILAKPLTFMNKSGSAAQSIAAYFKINLDDILVVHDDIDILLGEYKLQRSRSSAGHRGVQDIMDKLGSNDFWRLRIGVARPDRRKMGDAADFVLRKFSLLEKNKLKKTFGKILEQEKLI
ncbi:MAG: aminoacyl-tRNA hydrolase [Patescibacteria group bacterium]